MAKKNLLGPTSFLLRRSATNVRSFMPLHRLLIGLYDYQACSVGLKMDVYMHRRQESRSQSTVNRPTEFEVITSLPRNTVCTSVIVGYGVKMKRCLCVSVQCAGCYFLFSEVDKDVDDPRQAATQLEEEQPCTVLLERCLSTDGKATGEYEFGKFSSWSGSDWSPKKKPKRKDISLHDRSWAWRTRLFKCKWRKPCVGLCLFFFDFFLLKLVRSWRRPICCEMIGNFRHDHGDQTTLRTSWEIS